MTLIKLICKLQDAVKEGVPEDSEIVQIGQIVSFNDIVEAFTVKTKKNGKDYQFRIHWEWNFT